MFLLIFRPDPPLSDLYIRTEYSPFRSIFGPDPPPSDHNSDRILLFPFPNYIRTGSSPFRFIFGPDPPLPICIRNGSSPHPHDLFSDLVQCQTRCYENVLKKLFVLIDHPYRTMATAMKESVDYSPTHLMHGGALI